MNSRHIRSFIERICFYSTKYLTVVRVNSRIKLVKKFWRNIVLFTICFVNRGHIVCLHFVCKRQLTDFLVTKTSKFNYAKLRRVFFVLPQLINLYNMCWSFLSFITKNDTKKSHSSINGDKNKRKNPRYL